MGGRDDAWQSLGGNGCARIRNGTLGSTLKNEGRELGVDSKKSVSHKVLLPASPSTPSSERMAITKGILFHDLRHSPLWDTYLELEETGGRLGKGEGERGWELGGRYPGSTTPDIPTP